MSSRPLALATLIVFFAVFVLVVAATNAGGSEVAPPDERAPHPEQLAPRVTPALQVVATYDGLTAAQWAARSRRWHARARTLQKTLMHRPDVREAIELAAATYGYGSTLWRKARCESHLSPTARNRYSDASGLFQFLPSTWTSTPYGGFSIFSPFANALAAAWMHAHGRGGEWVCG